DQEEFLDTGTAKYIDQLAGDVHFLAAPFRLVWHLIIIFVLLCVSPLIFGAVVFSLIVNENFGLAVRHWLLSLGWFPPIWASQFGNPLTRKRCGFPRSPSAFSALLHARSGL